MATFKFTAGGNIERTLFSIGRTGAMKNVMEELKKIINGEKSGSNGIDWKDFVDDFEKFGFTAVYDRNMAILITALFAAIARAKDSPKQQDRDLYTAAEKVIRTKTSATITNAATNKGQSITLGQALLNGDGKAAHDILNNETFKNALGNIGLQGIFFTKFLNRVKKITPWRLSGSKKALGIVEKAFEAMTGVEYKTGNPLLEIANEALKCDDSLIPRFFSCLNSKEAEFLYKEFPNNKRGYDMYQFYFSDFEKYLDDIRKLYEDIKRVAPHDKQQFLFLMKKVVGKKPEMEAYVNTKEAYVNIIENIIKTMDNGKYEAGIEYNANTGSKDINEFVKKYKEIIKSDIYQDIKWNPMTRNNELAANDLVDDFKKNYDQVCKDLLIIFPGSSFEAPLHYWTIRKNEIKILYSSFGDHNYDPDASSGFEEFKKYFKDISDWSDDFYWLYYYYDHHYYKIDIRYLHYKLLASFSIIEKIVRLTNQEEKLRYAAVFQAICSVFPEKSKFKIDLDAAERCSCQHIKDIVRKYKKTIGSINYQNLKWKPLEEKEPSPDPAAGAAQAAATAAAGAEPQ